MLSARNLLLEPKLVPGGGATEMELACRLKDNAKKIDGMKAYAYYAVAEAMEVLIHFILFLTSTIILNQISSHQFFCFQN